MIPILYDQSPNPMVSPLGLGRLNDCLSCKVTEERNGEYSLSMEYPINGIHADQIGAQRIIAALANDKSDVQLFRILRVTPGMKTMQVYAQHISYDLSYYPVVPFETTVSSPYDAMYYIWQYSRNEPPFGHVEDAYTLPSSVTFGPKIPTSIRSLFGGMRGSILDHFGGEWEYDNYTVKWHRARGADNGVEIRYGKNLMSIQQELNISETVCGILPYYSSENEGVVYGDIQYTSNHSTFPFSKVQTYDFTQDFGDTVPTALQLEARARTYISSNDIGVPVVSTDVSFYPLWQVPEFAKYKELERVGLCDTVKVYFPDLGVRASAKVVKTIYDTLLERYDTITLGTIKKNLANTVADIINKPDTNVTLASDGDIDALFT